MNKATLCEPQSRWKGWKWCRHGCHCWATFCPILSLSAPLTFLGILSVLIPVLKISTLLKEELSKMLSESRLVPMFHFLLEETSYSPSSQNEAKATFHSFHEHNPLLRLWLWGPGFSDESSRSLASTQGSLVFLLYIDPPQNLTPDIPVICILFSSKLPSILK